jgi:hypothetical protein
MSVDPIVELLATAEAISEARDEAHATGWIVAVTDPETGSTEMFGPWPKDGALDAAAWVDERLARFTDAGDDGVPLTAKVYPLHRVDRSGGSLRELAGELHDFVQSPDPNEPDCADCGVMDEFHGEDVP